VTDTAVDKAWTAVSEPTTGRLRRVLYVADLDPSIKFGSLEESVFLLAKAFRSEHSLFLPLYSKPLGGDGARMYSAAGITAEALDLRKWRWSTHRALLRMIRLNQIDCIHWNFTATLTNGYIWTLSVFAPTVRHELTEHCSPPLYPTAPDGFIKVLMKRLLSRRYAAVWSVSDFVKEYLENYRGWRGVRTRPQFINTDRFCPDPAVRVSLRHRLGDDSTFVALVVGYLIFEKGVDIAIRAIAVLPETVRLWIVGDGPERGALERLCHELNIQDRVRFFGTRRHAESYMQAADCLLCPSRWAEAAGLVNLEAQSCGLPVIASRVGGLPEFVTHTVTGFLHPAEDYKSLAHYLGLVMRDPSLLQNMRAQARRTMVESSSHQRRLKAFLQSNREGCSPAVGSDSVLRNI
jgi:glycosyltransferase involved in cell wall biosynthesis